VIPGFSWSTSKLEEGKSREAKDHGVWVGGEKKRGKNEEVSRSTEGKRVGNKGRSRKAKTGSRGV